MPIITESQWVNYFGFQRFPFDRPEAGNEEFARPEFLASCFVEPRGFERVFGQADSPSTAILFAARGTGKTACRVMMNYYCQNGISKLRTSRLESSNYVLSVPHIQLDNVRNIARQSNINPNSSEILVEHHVVEILRQAVPTFIDMVAKNSNLTEKVRNLPKSNFEDLSLFVIFYSSYLSSSQKDFLRTLNVNMPPLDEPMMGLSGQTTTRGKQLPWESILYTQRLEASPLSHLELWAKIMTKVGLKSTYVLVDGVDELMESSGDSKYAHYIIRPLLTHLRLMEAPHIAFKFFLPSDLESIILSDPAFRRDRGFIIQKLEWTEEDLVMILRERLSALRTTDYEIRERTAGGFDVLCVPEIRGDIEQNIIKITNGNPRQLMNFCSLMVFSHCNRNIEGQDDPYQLNRQDFEMAEQVFNVEPFQINKISVGNKIDIVDLIQQGEGERIEFKSSIRYDYKLKAINKDALGLAIAKTIAGFMNRDGGTLVIGVSDDGRILGIEKDFETLTKNNVDGFQLTLKEIVKNYMGVDCLGYLHLQFENLEDHVVCVVFIDSSSKPVYLKNGNDSEFYVRMLNATQKLSLPETVNYIHSRWT